MKRNLKSLIIFNVTFYMNNFILIVLTNIFGSKDIAALWFFTPFIVILFTTSMIEIPKRKSIASIKKLSLLDFTLRCIILIVNFLALSQLIDIGFTNLIILGIIFMGVNIYIEWIMHKELRLLYNKEVDEDLLTKKELNALIDDFANDKRC